MPSYAPRIHTDDGIDVTVTEGQGNEALQNAAKNLSSELRRRGGPQAESPATSTGNSLFPSKPTTSTGDPTVTNAEAVMAQNRTEQEALTTGLLEMAKQLKQQSIHFGQTMESDKSVVDRAASALDTSEQSMGAATQRMGALRRMTEGRGWWDRMKLYAFIFGLWVVAFCIVFIGPKIRF